MRGKKKLFILAALLSAILIISVVFSSGVVDVLRLSLGGSSSAGAPESLGLPEVFVDPNTIIKDYENDLWYQIGNTTQIQLNITDATDLFAWQINVSWDPSMLNVSNIITGEFLHAGTYNTTSSTYPNGLGFVINMTDNATGYTAMGESILGNDPLPGVSGNGKLVTIVFQIVGYGCTNLTISVEGILPTILLNNTLPLSGTTPATVDGFFKNKLNGDANSDGAVNVLDVAKVNSFWSPPGPYSRCVDTNDDGAVNVLDVAMVNSNWGRNVPI